MASMFARARSTKDGIRPGHVTTVCPWYALPPFDRQETLSLESMRRELASASSLQSPSVDDKQAVTHASISVSQAGSKDGGIPRHNHPRDSE